MAKKHLSAKTITILRGLAALLMALAVTRDVRAAAPIVTSLPAVNTSPLLADDLTQYTVSTTVTDGDGSNDIRTVRVLFNYTESGGDQAKGRGLLAWGKTDADVTEYGGTWVIADATGGGRWAYRTDVWGGTTYLTPLSAAMTTAGKTSGGSGSRTVTWTFTVKAAWALTPVINDADVWVADSSLRIGWIDGAASFDVYRAVCQGYAATPRAPVVSNPTATTLDVAINPADTTVDTYAIMVSPSVSGRMFVQNDGTLGTAAQWNAKSTWGTKRVTGLTWNTTYTFSVRASRIYRTYCPSDWGPSTSAATLDYVPQIDFRTGTPFSPWVRGQCPYRSVAANAWGPIWDLSVGSMGRGLAGGLDADTYDWRDIDSGAGWGTPTWSGRFTTLELLQGARDHDSALVITANAFGGGYRDWANTSYPGVFVCQTVNPDGLAADWVRYTNFIAQSYRQGDEASMTGEDARVYNSISNWGGKAKLLAPTEGAVPKVQYWEIGNEPELGGYGDFLSNHYLSPTDYRDRYKLVSDAMIAVDPTLKFGPCLMTPGDPAGSGQWLSPLAADPAARIDFIGYHPYYGSIKGMWGVPDAMADGLRGCKAYLAGRSSGIRTIMNSYGRAGYGLMATEWNPVNWDAPGFMQSSQAMALGIAESCFSFAEDGVLAAHFWEQPQSKLGASGMFAGLRDHMGDVLVTSSTQLGLSPTDINWRLYVTKNGGNDHRLMIWGLNFNEAQPMSIALSLPPCRVSSAKLRRYGKPTGGTLLTTSSGMAWSETNVTPGFNPNRFTLTVAGAEAAVLVIDLDPVPDFDRDGDVDGTDYGFFAGCYNGTGNEVGGACLEADMNGDHAVDGIDYGLFSQCFNGAANPPGC